MFVRLLKVSNYLGLCPVFGVSSEGRLRIVGVGMVLGVDGYVILTLFGSMSMYPYRVLSVLGAV